MTLQIGAEAPDFELPSSLVGDDGRPGVKVRLKDHRGKPVVLAFYPLDFSPTCSGEVGCFRDDISQFQGIGAAVFGISVDSHWSHLAFSKANNLSFPLLADFEPKGAVARAYGLYEEGKGFASRATVIIDANGKVAFVKNHGLGTARSNAEIIEELRKLG